jgi:hypothetical protein
MSETISAKGSCLCGAVEIEAKTLVTSVGACHCSICRKWSGGPFLALDGKQAVHMTGEDKVSRYASSDWAERAFCSQCGTHLFYRLKQTDQHMFSAGLFNVDDELIFEHQIFIDEKPTYYCFADKTKNMTGAEAFAQFSSE